MNEIEMLNKASEMAISFLEKIVYPSAEELGGLLADNIKFYRFKNQVKILSKTEDFLKSNNINPNKISLKSLIPILENGSLEEDEDMLMRWSSLLAAALDDSSELNVSPSYPEILKQLSSKEAKILDGIYNMINNIGIPRGEWVHRGGVGSAIKEMFKLSDIEFEISIDNLYRLRLCSPPAAGFEFVEGKHKYYINTKDIICITELGYDFVKACTYSNNK